MSDEAEDYVPHPLFGVANGEYVHPAFIQGWNEAGQLVRQAVERANLCTCDLDLESGRHSYWCAKSYALDCIDGIFVGRSSL